MRCFTVRDLRVRVVVLVLFALAVAACGRTGIHVSSSPQPTAAAGAPKLLIRLDRGDADFGVRQHAADYLTDGTVVRWVNHDPACDVARDYCGVVEHNTLTADALHALHDLLARDADLLADPRDFKPTQSVGGRVVDLVGVADRFVLERPAGDRYAVTTPDASTPWARDWVFGPDIQRLNALADIMADPETLVGPEGLAQAWSTYRPTHIAVFISVYDIPPLPTSFTTADGTVGSAFDPILPASISQSNWPFDAEPATFGMAFTSPDGRQMRCGFADGAVNETLISFVPSEAGGGRLATSLYAMGRMWGTGGLGWDEKTGFSLRVVALLPEDVSASCADAYSY
jgi:hypothetical protein